MKKYLISLIVLWGCYGRPEIDGFNRQEWDNGASNCEARMNLAAVLLSNFDQLKGSSQNEVRNLLGKESRHELFTRTQKFFYYDLSCETDSVPMELRFRFDALGKLREGAIEKKPLDLLKP